MASDDPTPKANGRGPGILRDEGVQVDLFDGAVAAAARPWETFGVPVRVTWFPRADRPVVLASPGPHAATDPLGPIRLTFSEPVSRVPGAPGCSPAPSGCSRPRRAGSGRDTASALRGSAEQRSSYSA